jgi:hypothetical protein
MVFGIIALVAIASYAWIRMGEEANAEANEEKETVIVTDEGPMEVPAAAPAKMVAKKKTTKKTATKKTAKVDLDSMSKNELLAHAKANGVKANASMNKAAILEAIKNG